jgi:hypothetical protein
VLDTSRPDAELERLARKAEEVVRVTDRSFVLLERVAD